MLTPLGVHLAHLPVNVHIGKMIIFGVIFRCLDPILTIAAALTSKTPFTRPLGEEIAADAARNNFRAFNSDFLTIYYAYTVWRDKYMDLQDDSDHTPTSIVREMRSFCKINYLSYRNLEVIEETKKEYLNLLVNSGFVTVDDFNGEVFDFRYIGVQFCEVPWGYDTHGDSVAMINAAITAGLYPKIAKVKSTNEIWNKKFELTVNFSSVLYNKELSCIADFIIYNTAIVSGYNIFQKVLIWEVSSIDTILVILFSNNIEIKVSCNT